ncbi:hypothetical protein G7Y89_g11819 [Cudoniella acicularis]|uniref:2EXR domain-containing protein n=1 Tax=Cudoniella acicularis TaxID=354080 RepID=A0A8H4RCG1_9HELO|nr:hypothetical protein G7Y89_g11819 [Cudoniella acicularis]
MATVSELDTINLHPIKGLRLNFIRVFESIRKDLRVKRIALSPNTVHLVFAAAPAGVINTLLLDLIHTLLDQSAAYVLRSRIADSALTKLTGDLRIFHRRLMSNQFDSGLAAALVQQIVYGEAHTPGWNDADVWYEIFQLLPRMVAAKPLTGSEIAILNEWSLPPIPASKGGIKQIRSSNDKADPQIDDRETSSHKSPFNFLPLELRNKIWRKALSNRNSIIELRFINRVVVPASGLPAVFHVNRESRVEAIRTSHSLCFFKNRPAIQNQMHILPERDILYLNSHYSELDDEEDADIHQDDETLALSLLAISLSDRHRAKIQYLAINMWEGFQLEAPERFITELARFTGLRTLIIVLKPPMKENKPIVRKQAFVFPTWESGGQEARAMVNHLYEVFCDAKERLPQWVEPAFDVVYLEEDQNNDADRWTLEAAGLT